MDRAERTFCDKETEIRAKRPKMAICYDFDKTLSPDDMQTFTLIPSFGIDKDEFWRDSDELAEANRMDTNLAWMYQLIKYSRFKNKSLKREYFKEIGADVKLYTGVTDWFDMMNEYACRRGIDIEHYIISSGLKEIIEGSEIAHHFKRIYASSYLYTADKVAEWPAQAINYTSKTQYIFRIAKGFLEEYDERVNDSMPESMLRIPYENIVYIGDSATDIPCMRLVKSKGGFSIGVYDPEKNNVERVHRLFKDDRINFYAPADYSRSARLAEIMEQIIDEIATREALKAEREILRETPIN
ncbi:MAG: haloacid dehalogenase-like hydrolase [Clostridia bacterium]|nr:haloacid dehalogenase-like hydrolase [Clostridia bacterium]